nr:LysR family transcriptional regulator [Pseudovibrio sp. WM33]
MLEVFNAIAQNGSLKGAAVALGIKPSTVSHQLVIPPEIDRV